MAALCGRARPTTLPAAVASFGGTDVIASAGNELIRGVHGMTGRTLRYTGAGGLPTEAAIVLGTLSTLPAELRLHAELAPDAYWLTTASADGVPYLVVAAENDRGVLYGTFALLRKIGTGEAIEKLNEKQAPAAAVRWVNQWDNLDGTIERGYGGRSIFWDGLHARADLKRVTEYGRLLASIGINACAINNVNANPRMLASDFMPEIARIAEALRPWGVRVVIAVDFGSPKSIGGLDTFDPLDARVAAWWRAKGDELYAAVPDLAGSSWRTRRRVVHLLMGAHADAANVVARSLACRRAQHAVSRRCWTPADGLERSSRTVRVRRTTIFQPLDGKFDANVIVQIRHG